MSRGVLVIEADERSGALITARQACDDHGRPVFAMPGRVDNPLSAGPHRLIRDGAILASKLEDILEALGPLPSDAVEPSLFTAAEPSEPAVAQKAAPPPSDETGLDGMTDRQRAIWAGLSAEPTAIDALMERTDLPAQIVLQELTFLSLKGRVRRVDGQTFSRK
jgi:DNA processing protein